MAAFLDVCRFNPTAGGTNDFTYSSAVTGYQSPAAAGVVNARLYKYRAESVDLSQWEVGEGAYNTSTGVLARTTVLFNSLGTTAKISFSAAPQVAIVALKEDLISIEEANSFTTAQKLQARNNIDAAKTPGSWTRTVFTSGSGTYTVPTGAKAILVKLKGAGGGSGGSGTSGGTAGGTGGNTTFDGTNITAPGGSPSAALGRDGGAGGAAGVGGDFSIAGQDGRNGNQQIALGNAGDGGGAGGGRAATPNASNGAAGKTNSGGGGGGAPSGSSIAATGGGGEGAYTEKLIVSPNASYTYAVGAAGTAGTAGTSGGVGYAGGSGLIVIEEFY